MFLSKALLRYLSLAVPEAGTGVTFKRVTLAQRNSASTQRSVSVQGLKHLCISNTYIYVIHMWIERFNGVETHSGVFVKGRVIHTHKLARVH